MSDLRIALVAEGPTDAIIVQAALRALLARPFVLTLLQPEATRPTMGAGWGGVLRWCHDFALRGAPSLEDDPTLPGFDLFVLHVDADVAGMRYADVSQDIAALAAALGWPSLPQSVPCPPPSGSADVVRACLGRWLAVQAVGPRTVLCVPSKAIDAWLVAAALPGHPLANGLECNPRVEAQLAVLPVGQRIKKTRRDYQAHADAVTHNWLPVRQQCTQAERFSVDVAAVPLP